MLNQLQDLLHATADTAPEDGFDPVTLVRAGRSRVRRRRVVAAGGVALATAALVGVTTLAVPGGGDREGRIADHPPTPDAPIVRLADATAAVEGRDFRVLASHTNENLNRTNGQYFEGVTADGLVLFSDGPHGNDNRVRLALMDPATEEKDWLPATGDDVDVSNLLARPLEMSEERLLFASFTGPTAAEPVLLAFDRGTREWRTTQWSGLPEPSQASFPTSPALGPDGRIYLALPATSGEPPAGGWPTGEDGEADDAGAAGDTYDLWSLSTTDADDVRDEGLRVGDFAFTQDALVWTDTTNGTNDRVHVRDLATGEEHDFDPGSGERCNLLSFGASGDHVVMGQYCGTYRRERDDRVQVVTLDGEQVVTLQGDGLDGSLAGSTTGEPTLVTVESWDREQGGTYVYDLTTGRFLRLSTATSSFAVGGPAPAGQLLWHTPVNRRRGATQWLGELLDR